MQQGVQTDTTCNFQQCWDLLANNALQGAFIDQLLLCEKRRANWHKLCRNQFNTLKRVRALLKKGKASDRDEKMMTVERSYQRSIADTKV